MGREYIILPVNTISYNDFTISPIRDEDKYQIMKWRNDQIVILRQKKILTKEAQENYFANVVDRLFHLLKPDQLLFSFFFKEDFIGYGGLVHIDWDSKNAEVSFLTATERNNDEQFSVDFKAFLEMILEVAFKHLNLVKVHTTVFDLPQRLQYFKVIKDLDFIEEAYFKKHILVNGELIDVLVFSRFNSNGK